MPFDGLGSPDYQNLEKIDRVIELIGTPTRWCKGTERNRAGQYCIRGAMIVAAALETLEPVVIRSIHEVTGRRFRRVEEFNDHPRTTHKEVLTVLSEAREHILATATGVERRLRTRSGGHGPKGSWLARIWRNTVRRAAAFSFAERCQPDR